MFNRIIVIGTGLIGGSFCLAIRKHDLAKQVIGYDISETKLQHALQEKIIDIAAKTSEDALEYYKDSNEDLIVLATPLSATTLILPSLHARYPHGFFMELGSAKSYIMQVTARIWKKEKAGLIAVHPIAGSENNEIGAAHDALFDSCKSIITPSFQTSEEYLKKASLLWQKLGKDVYYMDAEQHDKIFSYTSHLPHFLAYSLVSSLKNNKHIRDLPNYSAGGLRDFTRIAASDEQMWNDIFFYNRSHLLRAINDFQHTLARMRGFLQDKDEDTLEYKLKDARGFRYHFAGPPPSIAAKKDSDDFDYLSEPAESLKAEIRVDGDKSISHRSIMLGSLAKGVTEIDGFLTGKDTLATLMAFRSMGVSIEREHTSVRIKGVGIKDGLKKPLTSIDCGNSGTAARLLGGILANQSFVSYLHGDESLTQRPMQRIMLPLQQMGARVFARNDNFLPLFIAGRNNLCAITYEPPVASAQVKSAVLLGALGASGETIIKEPKPTRDHTERMLKSFGYSIETKSAGTIRIRGGGKLNATKVRIPADISSAAFFIVAASICPNSHIVFPDLGINPGRTGVLQILQAMGGKIAIENKRAFNNEPVADVDVRTAALRGIDITPDMVAAAIDELPVVMIAAACADGRTTISGAEELRVKESNRLHSMIAGLTSLGASIKETPDGAIIEGKKTNPFTGGTVDSYGDHRIAMAFAVAGAVSQKPIRIHNCSSVATSFPGFLKCAQVVGMQIQTIKA